MYGKLLLIFLLKEFVELNVSKYKMIKNATLAELIECFLEYTNFKDNLIEYKCLFRN